MNKTLDCILGTVSVVIIIATLTAIACIVYPQEVIILKTEILTLKQISEEYNIAYQKVCYAARTGALKAVKRGTKYYASRQAANEYMGIENKEDDLKRDLEKVFILFKIDVILSTMKLLSLSVLW